MPEQLSNGLSAPWDITTSHSDHRRIGGERVRIPDIKSRARVRLDSRRKRQKSACGNTHVSALRRQIPSPRPPIPRRLGSPVEDASRNYNGITAFSMNAIRRELDDARQALDITTDALASNQRDVPVFQGLDQRIRRAGKRGSWLLWVGVILLAAGFILQAISTRIS